MSGDIVKRLRSLEIVIPAGTQIAIKGGTIETIQPISMQWTGGDRLEAAAEIERLRARVDALKETLGLLVDHQNGCPLPSYADEWDRAMAQAKDLLETAP